jgi:thiamine kinase-like enzyme
MMDCSLKTYAREIDDQLANAKFQTLVHGDAKVANFCFSDDMASVAAVDFQYVGKGIGSQDVVYFLGSCLDEKTLEQHIEYLLEYYFTELNRCLVAQGESPDLADSVCNEWYRLFPVAWADFHRFLIGWSPQHHKNTAFSRRMTNKGLEFISQN